MGLPVLTSVILIMYCVMMPFCSSTGGGFQESVITVELIAFPRGAWGGLDGTGIERNNALLKQWKCNVLQLWHITSYHPEELVVSGQY